jgi:hypothetical protein
MDDLLVMIGLVSSEQEINAVYCRLFYDGIHRFITSLSSLVSLEGIRSTTHHNTFMICRCR